MRETHLAGVAGSPLFVFVQRRRTLDLQVRWSRHSGPGGSNNGWPNVAGGFVLVARAWRWRRPLLSPIIDKYIDSLENTR
jgi:hypothetical protein